MSTSESASKRRRINRSPSPAYKLDGAEDYEPYIPVAQRKQAKLAKLSSLGPNADKERARRLQQEKEEREDEEAEEERRKERARKERTLLMEAQEVHSKKALEGAWHPHSVLSTQVMLTDAVLRCTEDGPRETR